MLYSAQGHNDDFINAFCTPIFLSYDERICMLLSCWGKIVKCSANHTKAQVILSSLLFIYSNQSDEWLKSPWHCAPVSGDHTEILLDANLDDSEHVLNKPTRLTSCNKIEPVNLCQLSISIDCRSQLIVNLSQLLISVDCWSQSIVNLSSFLISVDCWSHSIIDLIWLSISFDCQSHVIVDLMWLLISFDCQSNLIVNLSRLLISVIVDLKSIVDLK